ncbi:molybdopterin converting factor subunit 1 [Evansella sp. AB-P1]|uniref:molybdopterin converting factor subunit 1 n=1 Tax=Evansella sp. AB-P1 TaxID=3037653 RepID=UPI00241DBE30|nr:molybdopterin converting factor subunit 1 [Evansella sp. AB-P1]MDG5789175.1 molybdopterin converting factor subunit 1 [Evansella sp. AB-P1]
MIKILLFAELAEKAGKGEIEMDANTKTIYEIKNSLLKVYPQLTGLQTAMPAINEEYAEEQDEAKSGDTVAFIPPVSGG